MAFEYFDIPYRYNETCIKLLFQNPYTLFVFWDICDADENAFIEKYGKDTYYNSKIYLKIINNTYNKSFEIDVNPFAKSWYVHIDDIHCQFSAQLCRQINNNEITITQSNELTTPTNAPQISLNDVFDFVNIKTKKSVFSISAKEVAAALKITNPDAELIEIELARKTNKQKIFSLNNPSSFSNISSGTRYKEEHNG